MTNLEQLCEGLKEVAHNHGFEANVNYQVEGQFCIFGGSNIPTYADTEMLCESVGIPKEWLDESDFGIDIFYTEEWMRDIAPKEYEPKPWLEFWKRIA